MMLFYQKLGQGPPILILPGLLGSTDNWRGIAKQLALHYTLYLVDHRNHGQSFHSPVMTYEAMAADVCRLITELGLASPVLIGHSMGGKVAMQLAQTRPGFLSKLIVIDIAPRVYDMRQLAELLQVLRQTPLQGVQTRTVVDRYLREDIPDPLVRTHCMKNLRRDKAGQLVWGSNIPVLADSIPHLEQAVAYEGPFEQPTLFVQGTQSDYIQPPDLALMQAMFPHYILAAMPGAGHWVHYDQPQAVLRVINRFLEH
ncbi:MAG: alpha/beta fold hydrolase [Bacteroidota bacterium]